MRKRTLNVKKSTYRRRRKTFIKKRSAARRYARAMQNKSLSYVKKKYTNVTPLKIAGTTAVVAQTISHVGGVNTNSPTIQSTITLKDCDPDGALTQDMELY